MGGRPLVYTVAGALGIAVALFSFVDGRPWWTVAIPAVLGAILVAAGIIRRRT